MYAAFIHSSQCPPPAGGVGAHAAASRLVVVPPSLLFAATVSVRGNSHSPNRPLLHSPLTPRLRPAGSQSAAAGIGTGARDLAQSAAPPTAAVAREAQPAQLPRLAARARLHRTARNAVSSLPTARRFARSAAAFGARPPGAGGTSASIRLRLFGRNDLGLTLAAIETRRRGTGVCVHDTYRLLTALLALGPGR